MSRPDSSRFSTCLQLEIASEEDRPLLLSYAVASLLAVVWLVLVRVVPGPLPPIFVEPGAPIITFDPLPLGPARPSAEAKTARLGSASASAAAHGAGSLRDAFKGNAGLVDAGNILRGVDVRPTGSAPAAATALKVGLETGAGSRTPGITRTGDLSLATAGMGAVRNGGVPRHVVAIGAPEVRPVAGEAFAGSPAEVGQIARAHVPQLARCYHEEGLSRNASLAGLVRLSITVEAGRVVSAHVIDRSWTGAGAAEAERCLVRTVRGWRLGSSDARMVLPLSFTSPSSGSR